MLSIGIAQIPNTIDISKNFENINRHLHKFQQTEVDLVLFPECSLSGFTAKMREANDNILRPYIAKIQNWTNETGIEVVLPTAIVEDGKVYNSGFWFQENNHQRFYKIGLTDSEKKFFSVPANTEPKVFRIKNYNLAILICFEAEHAPWSYFENKSVDAILWPGYWGWKLESHWAKEKNPDRPNKIYANMLEWQVPLLQSNFAFNDLEGHQGAGPEGLSFVIDQNNKLFYKGLHLKSDGFIVHLDRINGKTIISSCTGELSAI